MRAVIIHAPRDLRVEPYEICDPGPRQVKVRVGAGGICGSDLHYYQHGGFGTVRIREPMVLGHEVAGTVVAAGSAVTGIKPGDRIAINPSNPCLSCKFCREGAHHHCLDMRFYGSAMRFPHVQGAFREEIVIEEHQAFPVGDISLGEAAFAEPLSVCLHAVNRAGSLLGKRVLVTGCGPIGCLTILAARHAGAGEIVATDIAAATLAKARQVGADRALDAGDRDALSTYAADKGYFDVAFECSGNAQALNTALQAVRAGGTIVQIGLAGGEIPIPINMAVAKEILLKGTFRFDAEFGFAVALLSRRAVDVSPLLTATLPLERAVEAFELAADRSRAMKVQLSFAG
ncbi:MAG TPA: L-idonate 5-dehydrogenase [Pseudorhodoplanes sp.]|jgi:L-idonate 5-dehydrogenase|nr:L-idonate 5-dehydrogenase [Pseudorhodoplanes sp.]